MRAEQLGEQPNNTDLMSVEQYEDSTLYLHARRELYNYAYPEFDLFSDVAAKLALEGHETVVDIGAGDAVFPLKLAKDGHSGPLAAIDLYSDFASAQAEAKVAGWNNLLFLNQDCRALELPDNFADCITALNLLYHVNDPNQAIAEFRRVLKPGGKLIISTKNTSNLPRLWDLASQIADKLNVEGVPSFYKHFDFAKASEVLPKYFDVPDIPHTYVRELRIPTEAWDWYVLALNSLARNFRPLRPNLQALAEQMFVELVKPQFDAEVAQNGYFTDATFQGFFVCINRPK